MIRVLYVSTSTTLGGAEKTLFTLASRLDRRRFEVAGVISLKPEGAYARRLRERGIAVESLGLRRSLRPGDARRLAERIERLHPDLIHAFMYQAIQLCRLAKPRLSYPVKLVSSPRVHYRSRSRASLLVDRMLRKRDELLVAESEASARHLVEKLGYEPSKVEVVLNGVEPPPAGDREARRRELGLGPGDVLVGAAGRLERQKGFSVLLEALARAPSPALRCALFGEGPQRRSLERLAARLGLGERVRLMGETPDLSPWLCAFDVYALPSLWEGLPNALLEAMAAGLPVVASAVDGVPEAVADGKDGLLVPPSRPDALIGALRALAADPARRAALGAAARAAASARFTVPRMLADYEAVYSRLAA